MVGLAQKMPNTSTQDLLVRVRVPKNTKVGKKEKTKRGQNKAEL